MVGIGWQLEGRVVSVDSLVAVDSLVSVDSVVPVDNLVVDYCILVGSDCQRMADEHYGDDNSLGKNEQKVFMVLLRVYIHNGQAVKICLATGGIEPNS